MPLNLGTVKTDQIACEFASELKSECFIFHYDWKEQFFYTFKTHLLSQPVKWNVGIKY